MSRKKIDLNRLQQNLQNISIDADSIHVPGTISRGTLVESYHLTAAVLTTFDPQQLRPFGQLDDSREPALDHLLSNCTLRYDEQGHPCWSLNHKARKQALARLGTQARLLEALDLTADRPEDRLQILLEAYLRGTARPIDQQSLVDLRFTLQIVNWLSETELAPELPQPGEVERRIAWEELIQPFNYLVRDGFHGREKILNALTAHLTTADPPPPLLIFGPGGVGKSTVLAEFILRQTARKPPAERIPFTYVDFDQPQIDPLEPLTILMTAARQLAVQYPDMEPQCREFIEEWAYRQSAQAVRGDQNIFVEQKASQAEFNIRGSAGYREGRPLRRQVQQMNRYIRDFRSLYAILDARGLLWLLVLDTFEEVQLRSMDLVPIIVNFLEQLRQQIPQVRVLVAGRGEAAEMPFVKRELKGFDEEAAIAFLADQDVTHPEVARRIFRAVTGNPLSLKLAARVVKQEKLSEEPDSAALRDILRKVAEGNIQGQLYRRVLDHITNPDVRQLAHPGLTLRLITPDLIEQVLAEPCEVQVRDAAEAQQLFDLLSREVSLVIPEGPNLLRHRPDVRAVMIKALHNDKPLVVHAIHKAAIAYYEQRDGAEARAEEIYHRFFVNADFSVIDDRWEPHMHETLRRLLQPALYELSPRARAWLAAQLRLTGVEDVDWDETNLPEWESYTEKRVRDRIETHDWKGALALLGERRERTVGSRLYYLETTILRQQDRWKEARRCAYEGIYSLKMAKDDMGLLDLLRQAIAIDLHLGHLDQVQSELKRARALLDAQPHSDQVVALELDMFELQRVREQAGGVPEAAHELRTVILERFLKLSDNELLSHPDLIRDILTEFGSENSEVLLRGLYLMTLGDPTEAQRTQLARAMSVWDRAFSQDKKATSGVLLQEVKREELPLEKIEVGWQDYMHNTSARIINQDIEHLLKAYGDIGVESAMETSEIEGNLIVNEQGVSISGSFVTGSKIIGRDLSNTIKDVNVRGDFTG